MQTALKILGFVLVGLLVLVVVAYVAIAGSAVLDARSKKQDAVEEIDQAVPAARAATVEQHDRLRATAGNREAAWTWSEVTCRWNTRDAGWIVSTYVQECRLQVVDLIPADRAAGADCVEQEPGVRRQGEVISTIVRGPSTSLASTGTYEYKCPDDLVLHDYDDARIVLEGERPDDLDGAPAWTVLRTTTPLTETDIGCHRWSVLFCEQPGDLALPEQ